MIHAAFLHGTPRLLEGVAMAHWSYCGMDCEECPVYQATQKQDQAHQVWLAAEYSSQSCWFSSSDMTCQGCHCHAQPNSKMCRACALRECASNRVRQTCAECPDFPCNLINRYVSIETDARCQLQHWHDRLTATV